MQSKLAGLSREPLVHFLAIGAGLFLFWHWFGDRLNAQPDRIVIGPGQVERITEAWAKTHLRPPTADELATLVEQEIDEEILYREAVAMGLDRNDLVIRKRLAVKMDFLSEDLAGQARPTDEQLQAFLQAHPEKFNVEPLTSFAQVYVDRSKRGDGAIAEAERLLATLNASPGADWQSVGDPLPLPQQFQASKPIEIGRLFGRDFPKKLSELPIGRWVGPVESGYGLHLVLIRERTAGWAPALDEVRDAIVNEWRTAQRQELNEQLRRERRARYAVTVQWPDWAIETSATTSGRVPQRGAP